MRLNIDEAAKSNPGSLGGRRSIIDDNNNIIVAFCKFLGECSSMEAECRALAEGLLICKTMNLLYIVMESNSNILV